MLVLKKQIGKKSSIEKRMQVKYNSKDRNSLFCFEILDFPYMYTAME